jgi:hypothetical protein
MKIISEHISFSRDNIDKLDSMGIGKVAMIKEWLDKYNIKNYIINSDKTIDVKGDVDLFNKGLEEIPNFIQFNVIYGKFDVSHNRLTSLKGGPKKVKDNFMCQHNSLTDLEYAPTYVGTYAYLFNQKMKPKAEKKYLQKYPPKKGYTGVNPNEMNEEFTRNQEDKLSSVGVGKISLIKQWLEKYKVYNYIITEDYYIDTTDSVNLSYRKINKIPDYIQFNIIKGYFDISNNSLTSLKGCPKWIQHSFSCSYNNLSSLDYAPDYVGSTFYATRNPNVDQTIINEFTKRLKMNNQFSIIDESFKKGSDKISNLNIGKVIMIKKWLDLNGIDDYQINSDLTISVIGDVYIEHPSDFPDYVQFKSVYGNFSASGGNLTTLRGFPDFVSNYVDIDNNELKNLDFAPTGAKEIWCQENYDIEKEDIEKYNKRVFYSVPVVWDER